jgi:hypothetical protein
MIYEEIQNTFLSLANQWRDLAESFLRLASLETAGSPRDRALQGGSTEREGLAFRCDHETIGGLNPADQGGNCQESEGLALFFVPQPNVDLGDVIDDAINRLQDQETLRQGIEADFTSSSFSGTLGPPPLSTFTNVAMFPLPGSGAPPERVEILDCRQTLQDFRQFIAGNIQRLQEITSPETTTPASLSSIRNTVDDIASYPMLTSEMGSLPLYTAPSAPGTGGGGSSSIQRTVETAVRDVLGHLPRAKDTRSFMLALGQAFQVTEVQGHTEVTWVQRSFTGQTDLGDGVTGAQASLYTRSKVALDNALPLLSGLYPLLPDFDTQLVEAARVIVDSELVEIVRELGVEGGPRVARVDQLFESLLTIEITNPIDNQPITGGHLGFLRTVFGLLPGQVNTLEEEHNVTNYIALQDYTQSIQASWLNFRNQWLGRDLGTRLVQLSRTLSVTAETVEEVNFAMDSVFVGRSERQVVSFHDQNGRDVLVDELLSWVSVFATEEAPRLVRDAGKRGAAVIVPKATVLAGLVGRFIQQIPYDPELPTGLRHPRVLPPLRELHSYLRRVVEVAQDINQPVTI